MLEDKDNYGLKRYEIGEIASRIGQLYYHYYLRTSDYKYLVEAFSFYEAIRDRNYFFKEKNESSMVGAENVTGNYTENQLNTANSLTAHKNPALFVKKLRYYARFCVICLLLDKKEMAGTLLQEFKAAVEEYCKTFKPVDGNEWNIVLQEMSNFLDVRS